APGTLEASHHPEGGGPRGNQGFTRASPEAKRGTGPGKFPRLRPRGNSLSGEKSTTPARLGGDGPEAFGSAAQPTPPGLPSPHSGAPPAEAAWRLAVTARWTQDRPAFAGSQVAQSSDSRFWRFTRVFAQKATLLGDLRDTELAQK